MTNRTYLFIIFSLFTSVAGYAKTVIKPGIKSKTTFAIVVDSVSYAKTAQDMEAYKNVIEKDGLGTYIFAANWQSPDEIRQLLIELHGEKSPLEGVVLVGDIPIPMIRDAQHLTSAFKMNQQRDWKLSSVASDRFYDDFGLTFDFIRRDSVKTLFYYYSLRHDSEQRIRSNIYSARIKPLEKGKTDKYTQLSRYLRKVVAERSKEPNVLNYLSMARGHGYNSESKVAWAGEQMALKEQFPELFKAGNRVSFMDFESIWPMKPVWLAEIQRDELDVMLFHHHGSNDVQYVNGYKNGSDVNTSTQNIKLYLRSKIRTAAEKGKNKEEAIDYYQKYLDIPRAWCEEAFDPAKVMEDSIYNLGLDIHVNDILQIKPNARFVMFDACYNGSFYEDEYIAGAYLFNDGHTLVAQGNTVNAIQDKWPDEFLGLLNAGLRVGLWGKQVHYLETHILGDPTYHFANRSTVNFDVNHALTTYEADNKYWLKMIKHPNVDMQAMALKRLYENAYEKISQLLYDAYFSSESFVVRMEAMHLLVLVDDANTIKVLSAAVDDSYELIRRFAVEYIAENGSDKLIPAFVRSFFVDNVSERVRFKQQQSVLFLNPDLLIKEMKEQRLSHPFYSDEVVDSLIKSIESNEKLVQDDLELILDTITSVKKKRSEISIFRNRPIAVAIKPLVSFMLDNSRDIDLRIQIAEVLGWYHNSSNKAQVVEGLQQLLTLTDNQQLKAEGKKSIRRLTK